MIFLNSKCSSVFAIRTKWSGRRGGHLSVRTEAILKPENTDDRCLVRLQDALQLRLRGEGGSAENTCPLCN